MGLLVLYKKFVRRKPPDSRRYYDVDANGTVEDTSDDPWFRFVYDERWRIVGTFRASDSSPKEQFVYHNAGADGRGVSCGWRKPHPGGCWVLDDRAGVQDSIDRWGTVVGYRGEAMVTCPSAPTPVSLWRPPSQSNPA